MKNVMSAVALILCIVASTANARAEGSNSNDRGFLHACRTACCDRFNGFVVYLDQRAICLYPGSFYRVEDMTEMATNCVAACMDGLVPTDLPVDGPSGRPFYAD